MSTVEPILTISVVAKLLDIHPRTIMLYEKTKLLKPHRTGTLRRLYSVKDLEELQFIKYLTRKEGINLQGVKFLLEAIAHSEGKVNLKKLLFPDFKIETLF